MGAVPTPTSPSQWRTKYAQEGFMDVVMRATREVSL